MNTRISMEGDFETPFAAFMAETSKGKPSPTDRFRMTLMGFLIHYFRANSEPKSQSELIIKVTPLLATLKRLDGSSYSEDVRKAVLGCLHTGSVFQQSAAGWTINLEKAEIYERRALMSLKKREKNVSETVRVTKRERNKKAKKALKYAHRLTAYMKSQPEWEEELSDPLQRVKGNESLETLERKLGKKHLKGLLHGYALFSSYFAQLYPQEMLRRRPSLKALLRQLFSTLAETQEALEVID